jgi:hypothetical protein
MVRFKGGGSKFVVLNQRDIKRRMDKSQTANRDDSIWKMYPEAMWAKSAVKELAKWMPQVSGLEHFHEAIDLDNSVESGQQPTVIDAGAEMLVAEDNTPNVDEVLSGGRMLEPPGPPLPQPSNAGIDYQSAVQQAHTKRELQRLLDSVHRNLHDGSINMEQHMQIKEMLNERYSTLFTATDDVPTQNTTHPEEPHSEPAVDAGGQSEVSADRLVMYDQRTQEFRHEITRASEIAHLDGLKALAGQSLESDNLDKEHYNMVLSMISHRRTEFDTPQQGEHVKRGRPRKSSSPPAGFFGENTSSTATNEGF